MNTEHDQITTTPEQDKDTIRKATHHSQGSLLAGKLLTKAMPVVKTTAAILGFVAVGFVCKDAGFLIKSVSDELNKDKPLVETINTRSAEEQAKLDDILKEYQVETSR